MNILVISGSRNPQGQTASAADALLQGVTDAGSTAERVFLPQIAIDRCRQCDDNGWGICRGEGRCVIEDDFAAIVDRIAAADAVVFATPVYYSDLSESLRAFLDRLRRTCTHEAGKSKIAGKKAVGICVAGGGGGGAPTCTVSLEKVLGTCGFDVVDMIPVRRQNLDAKREILRTVGKWLVG
jgi:multimeric flavodoxin WrbA